jgi:hypothetical protein
MGRVSAVFFGMALPLVWGTAVAHHSFAMFDSDSTIRITGTIKEFQWANPHVWIQVNVKNDEGVVEEWSIEGGGPNQLSRNGWRPSTFKPGDAVVMIIHPMKDGATGGAFVGAKFAGGETIGRYEE